MAPSPKRPRTRAAKAGSPRPARTSPLKRKTRSAAAANTPYRYIVENDGGTYALNRTIRHIGTKDLNTCLGVYFAIDQDRCFFAHINIEMQPVRKRTTPYFVKEEAKRSLVESLKGWLDDEQKKGTWPKRRTARMKKTLALVSPAPARGSYGRESVSSVAAQAVREWLNIPAAKSANYPVEPYWGFVVEQSRYSDATHVHHFNAPQPSRWKAVKEAGDGAFGIATIREDGYTQAPGSNRWQTS